MDKTTSMVLELLKKYPRQDDFVVIIEKLSLSFPEKERKQLFWDIGNMLINLNYFQLAIIFLNKAINQYLVSKSYYEICCCYANIGFAYCSVGDSRKAIEYQEKALEINKRINDESIEMSCYSVLGNAYNECGEYEKAIEFHSKSLNLYKKCNDEQGMAVCYCGLGNAYENLCDYNKAIEYHNKSLSSISLDDDIVLKAKCYTNLGNSYQKLGNSEKAIEYFEKSLVINKAIKNRNGEAKCYHGLGNVYKDLSDYNKAIEFYNKAIVIFNELDNKVTTAKCYDNLGWINDKLCDFNKAIENYNKSLLIYIEKINKKGESECYINLGSTYYELGNFTTAIDYYNKAIIIKKEINDNRGVAISNGNIGRAYCVLGDFTKAISYQEESFKIYEKISDEEGKAKCNTNFGNVCYSIGEYDRAIAYYNKSIEFSESIDDKKEVGYLYNNISNCYQERGNFNKAIEYINKSKEIAQEIYDKVGEASCYTSLGNIYGLLDDFKQAIKYHEKSLKIQIEISNKARESVCYSNLSVAYFGLGDFNKGIEYINKSLLINKEISDKTGDIKCYANLGNAYLSQGNFHKAKNYYKKSLSIAKIIDKKTDEEVVYIGLGNYYLIRNKLNTAVKYYNKALKILNETGGYNKKICLDNIGKTYARKEDFKSALHYYKEAVNFIESLRKKDIPLEYKRNFCKENIVTFDNIIRCEIKLKNKEDALEYSERGKGRFILDYLISRGLEDKDFRTSPMRFNEIQNLSKKIKKVLVLIRITKESTYVFIVSPNNKFEFLEISDFNVQQLEEIIWKYDKDKLVDGWLYRYIIYRYPKRVEKLLSEGKINKEEALEMLEKREEKWLNCMENTLKVLYQKLMSKIFNNIEKGEKVVIIPNRSLNNFPLHACFYEDQGEKHYLLQDYEITYAPNCHILDLCDKREKENRKGDNFFGVANPTSSSSSNLVFSEWEVDEISKMFKNNEVYKRRESKEILLKKIDKYAIIHLSTHGTYDIDVDFESRLLLGEVEKQNVYLTLEEIFEKIRLSNSWLVVLSACETGLIDFEDIADEYIGLQTGFLYAGAPTVIASLWTVNDFTTALLMIKTYENLIKNQMSKAESLKQAQIWLKNLTKNELLELEMLNKWDGKYLDDLRNFLSKTPFLTPFAHPYYWSGFQYIGV